MQKHSQLLQALAKQSEERNKDTEALAKISFKVLNNHLIDLFSTNQQKMNEAILEKNEIAIEEINQRLEAMEIKQRNQIIMKYLTVLIVGILTGIGDILSQSERPMDSAKTNATLNPKGNQVYKNRKKSNTRTRQTILYSTLIMNRVKTKVMTYGKARTNDVYPIRFHVGAKHMELSLHTPEGNMDLRLHIYRGIQCL